jgi:hypothetical protein
VLILAGANGEGTAAAGELVTNAPRLSAALRHPLLEADQVFSAPAATQHDGRLPEQC